MRDRPAEKEMRVGDCRGAARRDRCQPPCVKIGPRRLGSAIEGIQQADMRRDQRRPRMSRSRSRNWRSFGVFSTSMKTARNGVMTAPVTAVFATRSGSSPHSLI